MLCNTVSKNVYQAILFLRFIKVVIYSFGIGSLEVFSPKIRHTHAILMLTGQFSSWINQHSNILFAWRHRIKEMVFPPLLATGNVGRDWQERAVSCVIKVMKYMKKRGYPFHKYFRKKKHKRTTNYVDQHAWWGWSSKSGVFGNLYVSAYSVDLLLYWRREFSTMIPRLNCPV